MDPTGMSPGQKAKTLKEEVAREREATALPPPAKKKINWRLIISVTVLVLALGTLVWKLSCRPAAASEVKLGCCTQAEILAKASHRAITLIEEGRSFDGADVLDEALAMTGR